MKITNFTSEEVMKKRFAEIITDDVAMSMETGFHDALLEFAGKETNSQNAILIIIDALNKATGKNKINLSKHAEAMLDDAEAIATMTSILEEVDARIAKAKALVIPDFPPNRMGIRRGTFIRCTDIEVERQLGVKVGQQIPVGFDGTYVRCGPFTWDIEQLMREIEYGYWQIDGQADLSNPLLNLKFAETVDCLKTL